MSAFCVFGVSRASCKKVAETKVRQRDPKTKLHLSPQEWREQVEAFAQKLFDERISRKQISPAFDAPAFCDDWIKIGSAGNQIKLPVVMVRKVKQDKNGSDVKKDGKPVIVWMPYR